MKLAIIGTGMIVKEALTAIREVQGLEVTAIFGRPHSREKAEALAGEHGIAKVYTDYAELLRDDEVEFVYIGLINAAHYEYTKQALQAGKHVILEKPLTSTSEEAEELCALADEKKLYLFEAVTPLHMPNFTALKNSLPKLGQLRGVQANYSQYSSRYDRYLKKEVAPAFDPVCSGGALYDINIYNLNIIVALLGEPENVSYTPNFGFNGIDTSGAALLRYPEFFVTSVGAKDSASPCFIIFQGEKGWLKIEGAPNALASFTLSAEGKEERIALNKHEHRMVHEFEEFVRVYEMHDYQTMRSWLDISQAVIRTAEKARLKAGIVFPADADS